MIKMLARVDYDVPKRKSRRTNATFKDGGEDWVAVAMYH